MAQAEDPAIDELAAQIQSLSVVISSKDTPPDDHSESDDMTPNNCLQDKSKELTDVSL